MRVYIIGVSGSGKTTLGHELVVEKGGLSHALSLRSGWRY